MKAAADYLRQLVAAGHRVAICEQVEDPKLARGIVKRRSRRDAHARRGARGMLARRREATTSSSRLICCRPKGRSRRPTRDRPVWPPSTSPPANSCSKPSARRRTRRGARPARVPPSWCTPPNSRPFASARTCSRTPRERWEFDAELARTELARRFQLASLDGLGARPRRCRSHRRGRRAAALPQRAAAERAARIFVARRSAARRAISGSTR